MSSLSSLMEKFSESTKSDGSVGENCVANFASGATAVFSTVSCVRVWYTDAVNCSLGISATRFEEMSRNFAVPGSSRLVSVFSLKSMLFNLISQAL